MLRNQCRRITHQSTLLPSSASLLLQGASSSSKPLFPSSHLLSQPTVLFQSIASAVKLQTFLEDSQFGLQQSSLAIAGERLVVDVDLGVDLGGEEDESRMGTPMGTPRPYTPIHGGMMPSSALTQNVDERGKVKLLKLVASHVTPSGGTGQCEWVRKVLDELVNDYLTLWNAPLLEEGYSAENGLWEREEAARKLEQAFADLKWFDDVARDGSVDWFEELEKITGTVENLKAEARYVFSKASPKGSKCITKKMKNNSGQRLYPAYKHSVFPTFKLLPSSSLGPNPVWRIRPPKSSNESVPTISSIHSTKRDGEAEDVDMEEKWLETDWVIECIEEDGIAGVIVSRNWLVGSDQEEKEQVSSTIRLENLLVSVPSKEDDMEKDGF